MLRAFSESLYIKEGFVIADLPKWLLKLNGSSISLVSFNCLFWQIIYVWRSTTFGFDIKIDWTVCSETLRTVSSTSVAVYKRINLKV
jgi:hypothetical protein